ncbi:MAG: glycosyl hydrolase family 65 protein, partial [Gemmatimonadota bacterium]
MKRPSVSPSMVVFAALALTLSACRQPAFTPVLNPGEVLGSYDWLDNRDWDWYAKHIPLFDSPDEELNATYYYRWELLTKHLTYGSPETGYTFTEFIDRPFWSGSYGAISCPLGHQFYEIRWLKDRRIVEDFARYWFETPGAEPRSYSNWYGDAMWATYEAQGDREFLRRVYPHMEEQVAGWTDERWDPEHGMYRWVGAWDGMETNINSRLTDDEFSGAEGYRPTLNAYLFADLSALARTAALLREDEKAAEYSARASALKDRVQEELWDPDREFFFHQFAFDEKDGIQAKTLTYESGPFAGDPHGRELLGYVPWQFNLPDPGYETAWKFLMDPAYFWAPFGPTGVEQGDPQFLVSPRCCVWSGNAWPYATTQTLVAMANLLNNYDQDVVTRNDYGSLLLTYARSHRMNGRPYIAEAADPFTGSWSGHNTFYHSEHYLHSGFVDLVITGLAGLRPQAGDTLVVNPLAPEEWDYFALQGVDYHGQDLSIVWDLDGSRYGRGRGLGVYLDGRELARRPELGEIRIPILPPPPPSPAPTPRLHNYAVNNDGQHFPFALASSSLPTAPPFYAVDGNRWYHPSPPNRWVAGGSGSEPDWFEVDFGADRTLTELKLYFLDTASGPPVEAIGEEEASG